MNENTTKKGIEFEAQVAALYRSAGYDITQNYSVTGTDFDLLCTKEIMPHISVSIVVECKFKSGNGKVGPLDVEKFSNKFKYAKDFGITHGVIICANGFTPAAHIAAKSQNITLRSYAELEDDLLGFAAKFIVAQRNYQTSDIFHEYFGLEGTEDDVNPITDIETFVLDTLSNTSSTGRRYFVLGNFGAGKTTLVDRLSYRLRQH